MFGFLFGKKSKKTKEEESAKRVQEAVSVPEDYKFHLTVYSGGKETYAFDPSAEDINRASEVLRRSCENFVLIQGASPVKNIVFLQASDFDISDGCAYVQAQYSEEDEDEGHNYGKKVKLSEVSDIFCAYTEGRVPDLSDWEHIADF